MVAYEVARAVEVAIVADSEMNRRLWIAEHMRSYAESERSWLRAHEERNNRDAAAAHALRALLRWVNS